MAKVDPALRVLFVANVSRYTRCIVQGLEFGVERAQVVRTQHESAVVIDAVQAFHGQHRFDVMHRFIECGGDDPFRMITCIKMLAGFPGAICLQLVFGVICHAQPTMG